MSIGLKQPHCPVDWELTGEIMKPAKVSLSLIFKSSGRKLVLCLLLEAAPVTTAIYQTNFVE